MITHYIWIILKRDMKLFLRQNSLLIGAVVFPLILLLFIGFGFEKIINMEKLGLSYLEFLSPGIIVLFSVSSALSVGYNIFYDKESNFIKEILVSPIPRSAIVLGNAVLGIMWVLVTFIILAIILPLIVGNFSISSIISSIPILILLAITFSSLGLLMGFLSKSSANLGTLVGYINMPLFFLSGAFFPVSSLPLWLKIFAYINPFYYGIDAIRYFSTGFSEISLPISYIVLTLFTLILAGISTILFEKKSTN
ncbi:MAG TPA: ABC transporter permease [Candidatus Nanoarchaeia archaeon]|nr:ABC transporter permease [Candidatus Nanoarchaeia archaeon]